MAEAGWRKESEGRKAHTAGQTGLGKSTLVNTLFASHLVDSKGRTEPDISPRATTEIHAKGQCEFMVGGREFGARLDRTAEVQARSRGRRLQLDFC